MDQAEVDVAIVAHADDFDEHGVALVPIQTLEPAVQLAFVKQAGYAVTDVDEDAEIGETVDGAFVKPTGSELFRAATVEFKENVLLVARTNRPVSRRPANDAVTHLYWQRIVPA